MCTQGGQYKHNERIVFLIIRCIMEQECCVEFKIREVTKLKRNFNRNVVSPLGICQQLVIIATRDSLVKSVKNLPTKQKTQVHFTAIPFQAVNIWTWGDLHGCLYVTLIQVTLWYIKTIYILCTYIFNFLTTWLQDTNKLFHQIQH